MIVFEGGKLARSYRYKWTDQNVAALRIALYIGVDNRGLACYFGTSVNSIRVWMHKLHLRRYPAWTVDEDGEMIERKERGETYYQIAAALGRKYSITQQHGQALGLHLPDDDDYFRRA